ncbi:MAG: cell division protein ZapA [Flavobacteriales bacterium]|jgi:cell division protein ZapA|nr:cell division protein ZapA [Flavobacteriales bacterium]
MKEMLKIKVSIADRIYPLTVKTEEEEGIRIAVKKINELIKKFEQNYAVKDKQDVLAMSALQFASKLEVKNLYNEKEIMDAENKLDKLHALLDAHLK